MLKQIAFLRAINVGGRRVSMEKLREHFEELGLTGVETFIASGNVIFDAPATSGHTLQTQIEDHLSTRLGYPVTTFLRTNQEVAQIAECRPFDDTTMQQAQALNIAFLAHPLSGEQIDALMALRTDIDEFRHLGREIYWLCRKKQSESDFSNAVLERALQTQATFRTVNTLARLAAKYPAPQN